MLEAAMTRLAELYGVSTRLTEEPNWPEVIAAQHCPFLGRKCLKVRKSAPDTTIGTCSVLYGRPSAAVIICPHRFLARRQIFTDCIHLLALHEPGNELHILSEITLPGGSVDYFLVSARGRKVKDFVGIEVQTLDTTGTVWPERQRFLRQHGIVVDAESPAERTSYGMNWKMTAKTTLVQLHHKVQTFESINKHLVLVVQDQLLSYMQREFRFEHLSAARRGDPMQIHAYRQVQEEQGGFTMVLETRLSTDSSGIAESLGLRADPNVELEEITRLLEQRIASDVTLFAPVETTS